MTATPLPRKASLVSGRTSSSRIAHQTLTHGHTDGHEQTLQPLPASPPDQAQFQQQPQPQTNGNDRHSAASESHSAMSQWQSHLAMLPEDTQAKPRNTSDIDLLSSKEATTTPEKKKLFVRLDLRKLNGLNGSLLPPPSTAGSDSCLEEKTGAAKKAHARQPTKAKRQSADMSIRANSATAILDRHPHNQNNVNKQPNNHRQTTLPFQPMNDPPRISVKANIAPESAECSSSSSLSLSSPNTSHSATNTNTNTNTDTNTVSTMITSPVASVPASMDLAKDPEVKQELVETSITGDSSMLRVRGSRPRRAARIPSCTSSVSSVSSDSPTKQPSISREPSQSAQASQVKDVHTDDDGDYLESGSPQATKRRASSKSLSNPVAKKRTRGTNQGGDVIQKEPSTLAKQTHPPPSTQKRPAIKQPEKKVSGKEIDSITGDEYALKYNNDYCENCQGLGRFICCDSCPAAFHFSCCQPPVDPADLPDEWNCNECRAKKNPPKPSPKGMLKELMDNVNRMNPKAFKLPQEIRTFYKGVVTNSDGEYADAVDYKPTPKRTMAGHAAAAAQAAEEPYQLTDAKGEIRLCFKCNKSAYGGKMMISCEHCPLHWHLDCLSPPMASPPPSTRKWMCPNHSEHVLQAKQWRRKRKDAMAVTLTDPSAPNDGDIEVISDNDTSRPTRLSTRLARNSNQKVTSNNPSSPPSESKESQASIWDQDLSGVSFRIPERSIKLGFLNKMRSVHAKESIQSTHVKEDPAWQFDLLVAAMVASDHTSHVGTHGDGDRTSKPTKDAMLVDEGFSRRHEEIQDAVLSHLTDPEEREEYLRFRSFQRLVRETGAEGVMKQWLRLAEKEKEELAMQGLLGL
ncbi:hypothetical protein BGZ94_004162 [Podila epigama]|nr:hypothetical protein BGZ94_004162 [Podila epigama]